MAYTADGLQSDEEIQRLRQMNLASQGQVSPSPYFGGSMYDPSAASAGTGRGALSIRGNEAGYYGNGQWNSLGAAPQAGTPQFQQFVQQASYEGDKEGAMMAGQAKMPAPAASYGFSQPPSWAQQPFGGGMTPMGDPNYVSPMNSVSNPNGNNWLGSGQKIDPRAQGTPAGAAGQPGYVWNNNGSQSGGSGSQLSQYGPGFAPYSSGSGGTAAPAGSPFDTKNWLGSGKPIDPAALGNPAGAAGQPGYVWGNPANVALQQKYDAANANQSGPSQIPSSPGMLNQQPFQWNGGMPMAQAAPRPAAKFDPMMNNFFSRYWGK